MKLTMPSWKSFVPNSSIVWSSTWWEWLSKSCVCPWRKSRFMARIASGALAAISAAHSCASARELVVGHGPVHEPDALGLRGVDVAPEVGDLGRLGPAEQPGQVPRAARLGDDAALGEAGQQHGRAGHEAQVGSRARGRGRSRPRRR